MAAFAGIPSRRLQRDILDKLATDFWSWRASMVAFYTGDDSTGSRPWLSARLVRGRDRQGVASDLKDFRIDERFKKIDCQRLARSHRRLITV